MNGTIGFTDKNGRQINIGDLVKSPGGFAGKVVFANGAYRYDVTCKSGAFLKHNSSLLFCDSWQPKNFEVVI
jgi:hypothetical protein